MARLLPLTPRQAQVLALAARGLANKAIARALGISEQTVKNTLTEAYWRLGARNRTEAVLALWPLEGDDGEPERDGP